MKRNNSFRIAIWTLLLSVSLTVAMAVPNFDSTVRRDQDFPDLENENLVTLSEEINFPNEEEDAPSFSPEKTITATQQPMPSSLEPAPEDLPRFEPHSALESATRRVSDQDRVIPENDVPMTAAFDLEAIETQLRELKDKMNLLEQSQVQLRDTVLDKSTYLVHHDQLFIQLQALAHRLETFDRPATTTESGFPFAEEISVTAPRSLEERFIAHASDIEPARSFSWTRSRFPRITPRMFQIHNPSFSVERYENEPESHSRIRIIPKNSVE